ncbi:MAG: dihydropteroate synthase [Acidimicrobiales bacterium]
MSERGPSGPAEGQEREALERGRRRVMGVVNVTPDSFSDGGRFLDHEAAIAHGRSLVGQGADWVDVGGESTRPRAEPVPLDEELRRVIPVVEALASEGVAVSIDTRKAAVAKAAVAAGARMINDVSASLGAVAGATGAAFVAMHMLGDPRTMQADPTYGDVVTEVRDFLVDRADSARAAGVREVWIDPGIGFGKTLDHNLDLLANLDVLVATGYPVLVGTSRKSALGTLEARADRTRTVPPAGDRLEGSIATAAWSLLRGASMVRVHEVPATVRAVEACDRVLAVA